MRHLFRSIRSRNIYLVPVSLLAIALRPEGGSGGQRPGEARVVGRHLLGLAGVPTIAQPDLHVRIG